MDQTKIDPILVKAAQVDENQEISVDNEELLNFNKELIEGLLNQLKEKDRQITELHRLIENSQVLLKEEQKKGEQQLYLAEHFEEVDQKLQDLREKMIEKSIKEKESFFKRIFK